jgi:mono/diheme cytochrome c family protein
MMCSQCAVVFALLVLCSGDASRAADASLGTRPSRAVQRISQGLLVLYTFERPNDNLIRDRSGSGEPLDLKVERPQGISFRGGRLLASSSARISSTRPAGKIVAAVKQSGGLSIEVWVKPHDTRQDGPARIVTLSSDPGHRDFTLSQDGTRYDVRLRTTSTDGNGTPSIFSPGGSLRTELTHVVYTRDPTGKARIYINGKVAVTQAVAGQLANWGDDFRLSLLNELTDDRPWLGELNLAAVYGRALAADEVAQNFAAGVATVVDYAAVLPPIASRRVDFVKDVQPLLRKRCFACHAKGNEEGGLNLGNRQRLLEGGNSGPVLVRGDSASSRLIHLVAAIDPEEVMPPDDGDRLSPAEVGLLRAWIDQGANVPDGSDVADPRAERAKSHWAFQPLHSTPEPPVSDAKWCQTPIDRFIVAKLESAGIQPQPTANLRHLIRRAAFDLVGLPPTPEEVRNFASAAKRDPSAAMAALIDRQLASPHYGERWGRHWLDVARYADSDGQESDKDRPLAYRYRDFIIRAFNNDLPFDQFVRWQLAGDEYEPENVEAVAATGFLVAGPFAELPDKLMQEERTRERYNELDDMLATVGTGFMGLTLACARCHDHKYDAVPARDYYRMMAALHSGKRGEVNVGPREKAFSYRDLGPEPAPTWLFRRGDFHDRSQTVQLGFISVLTKGKTPESYWKSAREAGAAKGSTNQRRALAEWMTDVEHGAGALVARVIVNRIWQHHFGHGIVRTVSDFGVRSDAPSHPELLEWLAHDFVAHGWRIKRLHRMIMLSAVYQQASSARETPAADPGNRLLWKMPLQRIEGEILRDSMLSVSGTLNAASYGPAVKPPIAAEAKLARNVTDPYPDKLEDGAAVRRRSIYLFHKRVVPYPLLQAFDKPDAQQSCGRRDTTTVAPQALALLNDQFARKVSLEFADRLLKDAGSDPAQWIERGFQLALARAPSKTERDASRAFVELQRTERRKRAPQTAANEIQREALADLCQALFSLNEFLYVD